MKIALMQPYLFPYVGYFQLISAVEKFVLYDNVQFSKNGWINRNRILQNDEAVFISMPVKNDSHLLNINQRFFTDDFERRYIKILKQIKGSYARAPYLNETMELLQQCFSDNKNIAAFIHHTLLKIVEYLNIGTEIIAASDVETRNNFAGKDRVMAMCLALKADNYVNAIGGVDLYDKAEFMSKNMQLWFLQSREHIYPQKSTTFVPWLSIIDVLMFNDKEEVKNILNDYTLI